MPRQPPVPRGGARFDHMTDSLLTTVVLGLVEGITEFLPISSTGHLIVIGDLLGFGGDFSKLFDVVIQFGAILAVVWLYRAKLWHTAVSLTNDAESRRFAGNVLVAFLPAVVIGFIAHDFIKRVLFSPWVVAVSFIVGGFIILAVERWRPAPRLHSTEEMPPLTALRIGFFQCLAMIPGTSRSGATIVGALLMGVTREAATEFSFFLAIPTMFGATVLDLWKARHDLGGGQFHLIAIGFVIAFLSALVVVRGLVGFISRHGFAPFAWYRIIAGLAIIALLLR
jgi:undecaprenyl-diphosphatase